MAHYAPKDSFIQLAHEVVSTGLSKTIPLRSLLGYFHQERRSKIVTPWIEQNLAKLGIECSHDIDSVYLDAEIELRKKATVSARKKGVGDDSEADFAKLKDPVPRLRLLPAANRPPLSIARDATLERAVTLMLLNDFSQ